MKKYKKDLVQDLERLLKIKEDTIKELHKQVEILKSKPAIEPWPVSPGVLPYHPGQPSTGHPWWGIQPYIVTSSQSINIPCDPNITRYTLTQSDSIGTINTQDTVPNRC